MSAQLKLVAAAAAGFFIAGCASAPEAPTEDMTRARTLIEQAEKAGAQRYAAVELESARDKLRQADDASKKGNEEVANERAAEALADAELANARAMSGEARRAADELKKGNEALRTEAERGMPSTTTPTPNQ